MGGGRSYNDLATFAKENLKPVCSPAKIDLCEPEKKEQIEKFMAMPADELNGLIDAEENFNGEVQKLQNKYQELMAEKDAAAAAVKASGLGLMKSVKAFSAKSAGSDEL